jgi:hypothetical protein
VALAMMGTGWPERSVVGLRVACAFMALALVLLGFRIFGS